MGRVTDDDLERFVREMFENGGHDLVMAEKERLEREGERDHAFTLALVRNARSATAKRDAIARGDFGKRTVTKWSYP